MRPGTACADAPVLADGCADWLLRRIPDGFALLVFGAAPPAAALPAGADLRVLSIGDDVVDAEGLAAARYDGRPGTAYLIRPDRHVAARWRALDPGALAAALARAGGLVRHEAIA
jgi:3-(3-hydroxy-phenyl)propionate hydroxylase